jgi:hypothetical protein
MGFLFMLFEKVDTKRDERGAGSIAGDFSCTGA